MIYSFLIIFPFSLTNFKYIGIVACLLSQLSRGMRGEHGVFNEKLSQKILIEIFINKIYKFSCALGTQ